MISKYYSSHTSGLSRLFIISLVALLFYSGCYHWTPIVSDLSSERGSKIDVIRIGGEEGQLIKDVEHVAVDWPMLRATKEGKSLLIDLRLKTVEKEEISPGSTAALAISIPLGILGVVSAVLLVGIFGHGIKG